MNDDGQKLGEIKHIILHSAAKRESSSLAPAAVAEGHISRQAETDEQLVSLWLHGRSIHTQRAYLSDINRFMAHVQKGLHGITLGDIQAFADCLADDGLQPSSQHRVLAAVKSLITFAHKIGYLPFDVFVKPTYASMSPLLNT